MVLERNKEGRDTDSLHQDVIGQDAPSTPLYAKPPPTLQRNEQSVATGLLAQRMRACWALGSGANARHGFGNGNGWGNGRRVWMSLTREEGSSFIEKTGRFAHVSTRLNSNTNEQTEGTLRTNWRIDDSTRTWSDEQWLREGSSRGLEATPPIHTHELRIRLWTKTQLFGRKGDMDTWTRIQS